jgi:hypothetical protein
MSSYLVKRIYFATLPIIVPSTCIYSAYIGVKYNRVSKEKSTVIKIVNIIGFTYLGTIISIIYPISFPIIGCFYLIL